MGVEIQIRKIGNDELQTVIELAHRIWPQTYRDILSAEQINYMIDLMYSRSALEKQMSAGHQFVLLEYNQRPGGFASYSATVEQGIYKLQKIYVLPDLQGKGLGRSLIDYVMDELNRAHAVALDLNVNRNNKARWFYERLGFEIIKEEDIDIGGGYYMNDYVMRKAISR